MFTEPGEIPSAIRPFKGVTHRRGTF